MTDAASDVAAENAWKKKNQWRVTSDLVRSAATVVSKEKESRRREAQARDAPLQLEHVLDDRDDGLAALELGNVAPAPARLERLVREVAQRAGEPVDEGVRGGSWGQRSRTRTGSSEEERTSLGAGRAATRSAAGRGMAIGSAHRAEAQARLAGRTYDHGEHRVPLEDERLVYPAVAVRREHARVLGAVELGRELALDWARERMRRDSVSSESRGGRGRAVGDSRGGRTGPELVVERDDLVVRARRRLHLEVVDALDERQQLVLRRARASASSARRRGREVRERRAHLRLVD